MYVKNWRFVCLWGVVLTLGLAGGCKYSWPAVLPAGDANPDAEPTIDADLDALTHDASGLDDGGPLDSTVDSAADADPTVDAAQAICGNSIIESPETCDDGDTSSGDGCSSTCAIESGWYCSGAPSVCTTDCGDGIHVASEEECDDGNTTSGDGCNNGCMIDCSNSSITDCNYPSSTKISSSAFMDLDPPAGFVQCAGFINTAGDDVNRHWESNCLGVEQTLRIRYWHRWGANWILRGDGTLTPDSTAAFSTQTFDTVDHGGTYGTLQTDGVVLLADPPNAGVAGATSTVTCDVGSPAWNYGANDFYLGSSSDTRTLWVCSGDTELSADPCIENNELALVDMPMGQCATAGAQVIDATHLAVAIYYQVP
jgi:cysteine-rich repeat protein